MRVGADPIGVAVNAGRNACLCRQLGIEQLVGDRQRDPCGGCHGARWRVAHCFRAVRSPSGGGADYAGSSSSTTLRSTTISSPGCQTRSPCSTPARRSRAGRARATHSRPTRRRSLARRRCAAIYIPPGLGNSHFFGRGTVECNATGQKNPSFVLEDPGFMQMYLPSRVSVRPGHDTGLPRVQQPAGRQPPVHDRQGGARPDGGEGMAGGG